VVFCFLKIIFTDWMMRNIIYLESKAKKLV
jgi:hypothetical protein